jgi:tetratricopeptide (TPR) repeat protein/Zn-dependent protease
MADTPIPPLPAELISPVSTTSIPPLPHSSRAWLPRTAAVSVALLIAVSLVFPFGAEAYAVASIPISNKPLDDNDPEMNEGEPSTSITPSPRTESLGIRSLPLLTVEAQEAWATNRTTALQTAGVGVLGDHWSEVLEDSAIAWESGESAQSLVDLVSYSGLLSDNYINAAIRSPGLSESDILDLVGLLLLGAAHNDGTNGPGVGDIAYLPQQLSVLAYSLVSRAAVHFSSCDSSLAFAHALTLSTLEMYSDVTVETIDAAFDGAITLCGGKDVTPRVEKAYFHLRQISATGCSRTYDPLSWDTVVQEFRSIQTDQPDNPAGWYGEGDSYRTAANKLELGGLQPFTIRAYHRAAVEAYGQAMRLTAAVTVSVSLARAKLEAGEAEEALSEFQVIRRGTDTEPASPQFLHLVARAAAATGNYAEAVSLETDAINAPITHSPSIVVSYSPAWCFTLTESTGRSLTYQTTLLERWSKGGPSVGQDFGFVPTWRSSMYDWSRGERLTEYRFLAGDWGNGETLCSDQDKYLCEAFDARGDAESISNAANEFVQNLWRKYGDLERASEAAHAWIKAWPRTAQAHERLGEILFMQERWEESAAASDEAASIYDTYGGVEDPFNALAPLNNGAYMTGPGWAVLRQGVALKQMNQTKAAFNLIQDATSIARLIEAGNFDDRLDLSLLDLYARQELGQMAYDDGEPESAMNLVNQSMDLATDLTPYIPVQRGVQQQIAAVSALALGRLDDARAYAQAALAIDPYSPLFRETLADVERTALGTSPTPGPDADPSGTTDPDPEDNQAPDRASVIATYQAALDADPTLFSTWNNLGVLYAQLDQPDDAREAFEQALTVRPDYPIAWFNLGTAEANRSGLASFLRSQGSFGRAASLDSSFKDRGPTYLFDDEVYQSGLDVSKPIPPEWTLTSTVRRAPSLLTLTMILLVSLRLAWAIGSNWATSRWTRGALTIWQTENPRLSRLFTARPHAIWTTLITLGALTAVSGATGRNEILWCAAVGACFLAAHALAPRLSRTVTRIRHASTLPASLVTIVLAVFGLGFAPPAPLVSPDETTPASIRRSGALALGLLAVAYALVAWQTAVPIARASATAGLLLVSSALLPVPPLDGSQLRLGRWLDLGITIVLVAGTGLLAVGVL